MDKTRLAADLDHVLDHTRELWEELRGERLFITGGTGFFGCWLLESFAWANDRLGLNAEALVLTRDLDSFRRKAPHLAAQPAIQFHNGDVRSFDFPSGMFSHVVHAATESSPKLKAENHLEMLDTILEGTRHTLDYSRSCGAKRFLLTSSGAVYGVQPSEMAQIPEEYLGAPDSTNLKSAYGEGKRAAELISTLYARRYGFEAKIARCFAFVGPYLPMDVHFAIGNFIRDGIKGGPIIIKGDGTPYRSYLYAADLAIWLWTILFKGLTARPYNVGSDQSFSITEVAHLVADQFQPGLKVEVHGKSDPNKPAERYVPSIKRAVNELALNQMIGLPDAIQRTIQWIK